MMQTCSVILRECVRQTDKEYTYLIPQPLCGHVACGSYVEVPFGRGDRPCRALVTRVSDTEEISRLKAVIRLLDPRPVVTDDMLGLIDQISSRYVCTRGDVISLLVPSFVGKGASAKEMFADIADREKVSDALASGSLRSATHINILEYLLQNGECSKKTLMTSFKASSSQIDTMRRNGYIRTYQKETDPYGIDGNIRKAAPSKAPPSDPFRVEHELNGEQQDAVNAITDALGSDTTFLLHGITGSGKTEVYLKCAGEVLRRGGSVIYMVPEISLTPQTVSWITGRFGSTAAVLHSRLTDRQRQNEWNRIKSGEAKIVVGPRSCIFAPVSGLELVIIDEEHDPSYKSESFPRYNAREIAALRCRSARAVLLLGSATPSVTSYYAAKQGYYKLLKLTKRANPNAVLPDVIPVDMKLQEASGGITILSIPLRNAIAKAVSEKKQVLLFLNRRGFSRTLICSGCGSACECPNCSVGMTLHSNRRSDGKLLICHYCGYTIPASEAVCGSCGNRKFTRAGIGTQQLEEHLHKLYPHENILRMDQDSTMAPGMYEDILSRFRNREASILIGTQMIAKGHDFPDVTVVGILGADLMANSTDYRSSERTFQLVTQASGRAGRSDSRGTVFLQSYKPDAPLLLYAASQDYEKFYEQEIRYRQTMNLPPFKATGEILLSLPDEEVLAERTAQLSGYLRDLIGTSSEKYGFELYGPFPSGIYELRGRYRNSFVIKANNKSSLNAVFRSLMNDLDPSLFPISYDNDTSGI